MMIFHQMVKISLAGFLSLVLPVFSRQLPAPGFSTRGFPAAMLSAVSTDNLVIADYMENIWMVFVLNLYMHGSGFDPTLRMRRHEAKDRHQAGS